jgi:GAF domain-containing protein
MKQAILALTTVVMAVEDLRTCFLEPVAGRPPGDRQLKCQNTLWHGRSDTPAAVFKESEVRGKELIDLMDAGKSIFVANVNQLPVSQQPTSNTYKTCIAATVLAGDDRFGMLTIDSPKEGALRQDDVRLVEVLARLLGAALAVKP